MQGPAIEIDRNPPPRGAGMRHRLKDFSVADLTVSDASPVELIEGAAAAGFGAVGLLLRPASTKPLRFPIVGHPERVREIRAACRATGVRVFDVECFVLAARHGIDDFRPALEVGAELGATHISAIGDEWNCRSEPMPEAARLDLFGRLCDAAAEFGLTVGVEFMLFRDIRTMGEALRLIRESGRANAGLILDMLHIARTGGTPEDVASLPASMIAYAQFCDAPAIAPPLSGLVAEARLDRLHLGHGELPLRQMAAVLPDGVPLVVEVPVRAEAMLPPRERLANLGRETRAFLQEKEGAGHGDRQG